MEENKSEKNFKRAIYLMLFTGLLLCLPMDGSFAQSDQSEERTARNTVFISHGGAGIFPSFNYERLVLSDRLALRAGVFFIRAFSESGVSVPLTASRLVRMRFKGLYGEFGVGATFVDAGTEGPGMEGSTIIGVRYLPLEGGIFLRAVLVPYTTYEDRFFLPGVAIGYSF